MTTPADRGTFAPIPAPPRIVSLDVVRGFALWGVLLINMMNFGALMWDLYRIMAALEGAAARGVDELDATRQRELARELREIETDFERAGRDKKVDYDRLFELHNLFHDRLVRVCGRPRIRAMIETVRPQVDRYEWVYAPLVGPDYTETFAEHAEIIKAVRDGSGRRAQTAVGANWERGAERLSRAIGAVGGRGDW